jgi:hypothetical protein
MRSVVGDGSEEVGGRSEAGGGAAAGGRAEGAVLRRP